MRSLSAKTKDWIAEKAEWVLFISERLEEPQGKYLQIHFQPHRLAVQ